jgi:hypothetical protein
MLTFKVMSIFCTVRMFGDLLLRLQGALRREERLCFVFSQYLLVHKTEYVSTTEVLAGGRPSPWCVVDGPRHFRNFLSSFLYVHGVKHLVRMSVGGRLRLYYG